MAITVTAADSPYQISCTYAVILVDTSAGPVTLNLPPASSAIASAVRTFRVSKITSDPNNVIIVAFAGENINQVASFNFNETKSLILYASEKLYWSASLGALNPTVLSVKDFGAKGDGITDDTLAIQAAIDSFPDEGSALYIPPGTYIITNTLVWAGTKAVRMTGAGMRTTVLDWKGGNNKQIIRLDSVITLQPLGDFLSDFTLSNSIAATGLIGIQSGPSTSFNNRNITRIERILFDTLNNIGILIGSGVDVFIIEDCGFAVLDTGIKAVSTGGGVLSELIVSGCNFGGMSSWAMDLYIGGSCHIGPSNLIQAPIGNSGGIRVDNFDSLTVENNRISLTNSAGTGLYIGKTTIGGSGLSGASIVANQFNFASTPAGSHAIALDYVKGAIVEANAFTNVDTAIVLTSHASSILILQQNWGTGIVAKINDSGASGVAISDDQIGYGIGTLSPQALFHLTKGGTTPAISSNVTQAVIQNNSSTTSETGLTFISGSTGKSTFRFGNSANQAIDYLEYDYVLRKYKLPLQVAMPSLPTSNSGLVTGDLWCDTTAGNVLKLK